jgi:hypothetical protein
MGGMTKELRHPRESPKKPESRRPALLPAVTLVANNPMAVARLDLGNQLTTSVTAEFHPSAWPRPLINSPMARTRKVEPWQKTRLPRDPLGTLPVFMAFVAFSRDSTEYGKCPSLLSITTGRGCQEKKAPDHGHVISDKSQE